MDGRQETGPLPDATQKGRRLSGGNRVSLPLVQLLGALEGGVRLSTAACEMQQLSKVHERVGLHVERIGGLGTFDGLAHQNLTVGDPALTGKDLR